VLDLPRLNVLGLAWVELGTPVLNAEVDLSAASDHLSAAPSTSSDGLLSVDFATGRMSVDLAQLVEGDELNGLAPNTEILTDDDIARITSALTDLLAQTVGSVSEAANDVLESTALTVTIDGEIGLLLGLVSTDLDVTVDTTISDVLEGTTAREDISVDADLSLLGLGISEDDVLDALLSPVLDDVLPALVAPLTTVLDDGGRLVTDAAGGVVSSTTQLLSPVLDGVLEQLLTITVNGQDRPGTLGEGSFTVAALRLGLLPGLTGQPLATVSLASSSVRVVR
ncbi:choice-of-anchor G family protein, partial [Georgenia sp. 10Sc9-8]|nr:choice-of-anchor G family protein [Georgenia halotolerans]